MRILGLMGSSRKNGNTEILLDLALDEAGKRGAEVSKIRISDLAIAPCDGCQRCIRSGKCVVEDDMQTITDAMLAADGIIWATPVYFWSMSGQTKIVMDRTYSLAFPKLQLMNKVGGLIMAAGIRGCQNTANIFHMYFNYNHMFSAEYVSGYAGGKGDIKKDAYAVNAARELAGQMIGLIRADLKYPAEFESPMLRHVWEKHLK